MAPCQAPLIQRAESRVSAAEKVPKSARVERPLRLSLQSGLLPLLLANGEHVGGDLLGAAGKLLHGERTAIAE